MAFPELAAANRALLAQWGDPVRYETSEGNVIDLSGIFDAPYVLADAGHTGVATLGPRLFVRLADLQFQGRAVDPDADLDPTVTVGGVAYQVREVQKDGEGGAYLFLHKAG